MSWGRCDNLNSPSRLESRKIRGGCDAADNRPLISKRAAHCVLRSGSGLRSAGHGQQNVYNVEREIQQ